MKEIELDNLKARLEEFKNLPYREISKHFGGVNAQTIRNWYIRLGIDKPKGPWPTWKLSEGTMDEAKVLQILKAGSGKSLRQVADELGVTKAWVGQLYKKYRIDHEGATTASDKAKEWLQSLEKTFVCSATVNKWCKEHGVNKGAVYYASKRVGVAILRESDVLFAQGMHKCLSCDKVLPLVNFYKQEGTRHGVAYRCKGCSIERLKEYQKNRHD